MLEVGQDLSLGPKTGVGPVRLEPPSRDLDGDASSVLSVGASRQVDPTTSAAAQLSDHLIGADHGLPRARSRSEQVHEWVVQQVHDLRIRIEQGRELAPQGLVTFASSEDVGMPLVRRQLECCRQDFLDA